VMRLELVQMSDTILRLSTPHVLDAQLKDHSLKERVVVVKSADKSSQYRTQHAANCTRGNFTQLHQHKPGCFSVVFVFAYTEPDFVTQGQTTWMRCV